MSHECGSREGVVLPGHITPNLDEYSRVAIGWPREPIHFSELNTKLVSMGAERAHPPLLHQLEGRSEPSRSSASADITLQCLCQRAILSPQSPNLDIWCHICVYCIAVDDIDLFFYCCVTERRKGRVPAESHSSVPSVPDPKDTRYTSSRATKGV